MWRMKDSGQGGERASEAFCDRTVVRVEISMAEMSQRGGGNANSFLGGRSRTLNMKS